jgi:hypothetical protein
MSLYKIAALGFAVSVLAGSAQAVTVPLSLAQFSGGVSGGGPGSHSYSGLTGGSVSYSDTFGSISSLADADNGMRVHISGSTTAQGASEIADATITYYFAILTPTPGDVHVIINGAAQTAGSGSYFAEADVGLFGSDINEGIADAHTCANVGYCYVQVPSDGGADELILTGNHTYELQLHVDGYTTNPFSSFDAWADPTIMFDPAYDIPTGATFAFSDNLTPDQVSKLVVGPGLGGGGQGGVGGVPEPASWALMVMGFGGLGATLRRQRRSALA